MRDQHLKETARDVSRGQPRSNAQLAAGLRDLLLRLQNASDALANAASATLGLNTSDFACLRVLLAEGPCTAGTLAETTGLTTGAITGIVDRLEKAGLVGRDSDPDDRRRVIAFIRPEQRDRIAALTVSDTSASWEQEFNEAGLRLLTRFTAQQLESVRAETERLRALSAAAQLPLDASGVVTVPLAGRTSATLEIVGGAMDLRIASTPDPELLARGEFASTSTRLSERDGHLRISTRGRVGSERPAGTLQLSRAVAWAIRVSGGNNRLTFALEDTRVESVEIVGGDGDLQFALGCPAQPLVVRVEGGESRIAVTRAAGVPVEVSIRGLLPSLTADGVDLGPLAQTKWRSTPEALPAIRIAVRGGLNRLTLA
jgi:DNA-binding MarR family transcriptional regulator